MIKYVKPFFNIFGKIIGGIILMIPVMILFYIFGANLSQYEIIAEHPNFDHMIGQHYETTHDYLLYGINMEDPIGINIDSWQLSNYPGISGREVKHEQIIPKNSIFAVHKLAKCVNCTFLGIEFEEDIQIGIRFSENISPNIVWLDTSFDTDVFISKDTINLNPKFFKKLDD